MIYGIYSIRDNVAQSYAFPFTAVNDDVAIRQFNIACSDPASPMSKCSGDYDLYCIGHFDAQIGEIVENDSHNIIARGYGKDD